MTSLLRILVIAAAFLLAGCATRPEHTERITRNDRITAVLNKATYLESKRCLSTRDYDSVTVLDKDRLLFSDRNEAWVNVMRSSCPYLQNYDTVVLDLTTNRACSLDFVYGVDRFFMRWQRGPSCTLGEFHRISEPDLARLNEVRREH